MTCYFDGDTREVIILMNNQRLTIPEYMTIADIQAFVTDKQYQGAMMAIQMHSYPENTSSPMDKAMDHYKERGWFRSDNPVRSTNE